MNMYVKNQMFIHISIYNKMNNIGIRINPNVLFKCINKIIFNAENCQWGDNSRHKITQPN